VTRETDLSLQVELDDHVLTAVESPVNVRAASMVQRQLDYEKAADSVG